MKKIRFYVGANNATKELEQSKIEAVLNKHYEGYTAYEVVGYWRGERGNTLLVEVISDEADTVHVKIAKELKKECQQQSVLVEITEVNATFVN